MPPKKTSLPTKALINNLLRSSPRPGVAKDTWLRGMTKIISPLLNKL
jgi:hypothetical protein